MQTLSVAEIINGAIASKGRKAKIEWLSKYKYPAVETVLGIMYNKNTVEILLPPTKPPYKPTTDEDCGGLLHREARRLRIFIKGNEYDNLNQTKREGLFIALLEQVDPDDAIILCKMLKQKPLVGLSKSVINVVYKDLVKE